MSEVRHPVGALVGARMTKNDLLWPGIVINPERCGLTYVNTYEECIFWFGDHRASMVRIKNVEKLEECLYEIMKQKNRIILTRGIIEILRILASRLDVSPSSIMSEKGLLEWAAALLQNFPRQNSVTFGVPSEIKVHLQIIKAKVQDEKLVKNETEKPKGGATKDCILKNGQVNWDVCIACMSSDVLHKHPIFELPLCEECLDDYQENFFYIGEDGIKHCCTVCGSYGNLLICSNTNCCRAYCKQCVDQFLGKNKFSDLAGRPKWDCCLCTTLKRKSSLKVRKNWEKNISLLYHHGSRTIFKQFGTMKASSLAIISNYRQELFNMKSLQMLNIKKVMRCYVKNPNKENNNSYRTFPKVTWKKIFHNNDIDIIIGSSGNISEACISEECLPNYLKLSFAFYEIIHIFRKNNPELVWIIELPAAVASAFEKDLSRFFNVKPVVFCCGSSSSLFAKYRFLWSNFSLAKELLEHMYKLDNIYS